MHVRVPFLKLLESFALLRFVSDSQDAVQLLDERLALHATTRKSYGVHRCFCHGVRSSGRLL